MTPMIDVVLLLLIFFMTVSQISRRDDQQIKLPQLAGSDNQPQRQFTVQVDAAGIWLAEGGQRDEAWTRQRVQREIQDPQTREQLMIVVRADQRSDTKSVNRLVNLLRELEIKRVRFAVAAR